MNSFPRLHLGGAAVVCERKSRAQRARAYVSLGIPRPLFVLRVVSSRKQLSFTANFILLLIQRYGDGLGLLLRIK